MHWEVAAAEQAGVVSRAQALAGGLSSAEVAWRLRRGSWRAVHPGSYLTFTGPVPWVSRLWAALLFAGPGAVASHASAGRLQGLVDTDPETIEVTVPWGTSLRPRSGVRFHRSRRVDERRHPARSLPQTRVEETVLDLADGLSQEEDVVAVVLRACQRRLTAPVRLRACLAGRRRHRWRSLVLAVTEDAAAGVHSALERRWQRDVETAHGLPRPERQGLTRLGRRRWYHDLRHAAQGVRVQLEGVAWHPDDRSWQDDARDNAALLVDGDVVLRYGWLPVTRDPCRCAREVAAVLRRRGWQGLPVPCSPSCTVRLAA